MATLDFLLERVNCQSPHNAGQDQIVKALSVPFCTARFSTGIPCAFRGNDGEERKVDRIHPEAITRRAFLSRKNPPNKSHPFSSPPGPS